VDHDASGRGLDPFAAALIRKKTRQIIGRAGLARQDRSDIEQELTMMLWARLPAFDPTQGHLYPFVTAVIDRCVAKFLRHRRAKKRNDQRRTDSLHSLRESQSGEVSALGESVTAGHQDARRGCQPRDADELAQLARDISDVLATLPPAYRELATRLRHQSVADAARDLGVPRTTLNDWVGRIRRRFEQAGLRNYLENRPSSDRAPG
jgi:RNA polymerase sigma factor (sigma-70 family)